MARRKEFQTNFSAGELAPELAARSDTTQYKNGAKSLRNMRTLIGGGVTRRPGMPRLDMLTQDSRVIEFIVNRTTKYFLAFHEGGMNAYLENGTAAGSVTTTAWNNNIWRFLDFAQTGNTMFVAHREMEPHVLTRTGATTWTVSGFPFLVGAGGRIQQPYFKFAAADTTLQPSALTGSITLTSSVAHFDNSYIGERIRYLGREVAVTFVNAPTIVTGTVIEELPGTQNITVASSAGFAVGELVSGSSAEAEGEVTAVPDATHVTVVITEGVKKFTNTGTLIGPNNSSAISAVADDTPAAITDWDEPLFGVYGFPNCVEIHRKRVLFGGHTDELAGNVLVGSSLHSIYDFDVGDASDADGFFERIGDAGASEILQLHSAEQLLIGTDAGLYYIPETAANPFRPTSIAFVPFGSQWTISFARPRPFDGGVLFTSGSLVIKAVPTGDTNKMWDAQEVSLLAPHLISSPTEIAVTSNFNGGAERYAILTNDDGTLAVMQLVEKENIRNLVPWDTNGEVRSVAASGATVFAIVRRVFSFGTRYCVERFDQDFTLDSAKELADLADVPDNYGTNDAVNVVVGRYNLGIYPLTVEEIPAGPYTVGFDYTTRVETLPPVVEGPFGSSAGDLMRIASANVHVYSSSRFAAQGTFLSAYQADEDLGEPPPPRTGSQRFTFLGWQREPTLVIEQEDPLPLTVLGINMEVVW